MFVSVELIVTVLASVDVTVVAPLPKYATLSVEASLPVNVKLAPPLVAPLAIV